MVKYEYLIRAIEEEFIKSHQRLLLPKPIKNSFNKFHKETCEDKYLKKERIIITDKDGNVVYEKTGGKTSVRFPSNRELDALYQKYGDLYVDHNHPREGSRRVAECLSQDDMLKIFSITPLFVEGQYKPIDNVHTIKSVSMESPNGSRMTLTRGDYWDKLEREDQFNTRQLCSKLQKEYVNYMEEYINKREEVTEQTTADEARQFLDDDYHFRSRDFRNYLSEQTMKKMERFEDTETFKDIQKQFRKYNCKLVVEYPSEYKVDDETYVTYNLDGSIASIRI